MSNKEDYEAELKLYKEQLQYYTYNSWSTICRQTMFQNCGECCRWSCGDNTNKAFKTYRNKTLDEVLSSLAEIQHTINEQARDEGLWFNAEIVTEEYLQKHLRELHEVCEQRIEEIYKMKGGNDG